MFISCEKWNKYLKRNIILLKSINNPDKTSCLSTTLYRKEKDYFFQWETIKVDEREKERGDKRSIYYPARLKRGKGKVLTILNCWLDSNQHVTMIWLLKKSSFFLST